MPERNSIWDEMRRMQEDMDRLFSNFFVYEPFEGQRKLIPAPDKRNTEITKYRQPISDVWETDNEVVATLEMPGVNKGDISINVSDTAVEVKVEKKDQKEDRNKGMYRLERSYKGFYRCFSLPSHVRADEADATYKNGVLEIKIPKKKEHKDNIKKITVK